MIPCLFYTIFFLGLLEVSPAILCVVANFDDEYGVKGLRDALTMVNVVIGACLCVFLLSDDPMLHHHVASRELLLLLCARCEMQD